LKKTEAEVDII